MPLRVVEMFECPLPKELEFLHFQESMYVARDNFCNTLLFPNLKNDKVVQMV